MHFAFIKAVLEGRQSYSSGSPMGYMLNYLCASLNYKCIDSLFLCYCNDKTGAQRVSQ